MTADRLERRADPRSATAALLSFFFPGVGQAYNGQWALAGLLAMTVILIVALAALLVLRDGSFADELLQRPEATEILSVRPGITGLWQTNDRSDRTFEERVAYDVRYVRDAGIRMDVPIVARTLSAVFSGRGAY